MDRLIDDLIRSPRKMESNEEMKNFGLLLRLWVKIFNLRLLFFTALIFDSCYCFSLVCARADADQRHNNLFIGIVHASVMQHKQSQHYSNVINADDG